MTGRAGISRPASMEVTCHTGWDDDEEAPVGSDFEEQAVRAGGTAGTLAGALSGARLLGGVVPVPFVGPVVGAVIGGVVGSELGRRLGKAVITGGASFVQTLVAPSD